MRKRLHRKKKRRQVPVPIASMGDIAFLLIIFFMVCSEVVKDNPNMEVTLAVSEYVEEMDEQMAARVAMDAKGDIYFDGVLVDSVKDVEWGVRAVLTNAVSDDQKFVQFKCDAELTKADFDPVIKAIVEAGGILKAVGELPSGQ